MILSIVIIKKYASRIFQNYRIENADYCHYLYPKGISEIDL